ncbi:unnamed protein product [Paramecium primaurelia]|uniref:Uncharacterized protein n=1 Tax=Paramecium primaurelia TaxID=5886 RepID=A0A8S1LVT7_PARPR|nr:unnamed protein product [Paramecium primaurelia]CAD8070109.1 unnamed protein product [Paramecium primaurelia]
MKLKQITSMLLQTKEIVSCFKRYKRIQIFRRKRQLQNDFLLILRQSLYSFQKFYYSNFEQLNLIIIFKLLRSQTQSRRKSCIIKNTQSQKDYLNQKFL